MEGQAGKALRSEGNMARDSDDDGLAELDASMVLHAGSSFITYARPPATARRPVGP